MIDLLSKHLGFIQKRSFVLSNWQKLTKRLTVGTNILREKKAPLLIPNDQRIVFVWLTNTASDSFFFFLLHD